MINELYDLSKSLNSANIETPKGHPRYESISHGECICITVSEGKVVSISQVSKDLSRCLKKYASTQGSYPCMNLAPLYRITDETIKKELINIRKNPASIDDACISKMKTWCVENNWEGNFPTKYKVSMVDMPGKLCLAAARYEPLKILIDETKLFANAPDLHSELEKTAWEMLKGGKQTSLALSVLFYQNGTSTDSGYGSLLVAFDSMKLIERQIPAVSEKFVHDLSRYLYDIYTERHPESEDSIDAFGVPFQTIEEPMPKVELADRFKVILRTMFKEQHCQTRYGKIENASYPISRQMRMELWSALEWAADSERENITWINTDKDNNEVLFAYPLFLPEISAPCAGLFKRPDRKDITFSEKAKQFIEELKQTKETGTDTHAKQIRIFILRKIDKARTKVVYTKQTDAYELEKCSEEWTLGCANLPKFPFTIQGALYPLDVADILNCFWKQNGEIAADKFKPFCKYHGIELLMEPDLPVVSDLHRLSESAMTIGTFFGNLRAKNDFDHPAWEKVKDMLVLAGLLLYREHIRKDDYMDNLPYIYGQLLKAADELHALYCKVVRNGDIPPQFAGSSLFLSAAEAPVHTMNVLSQRIMPYYSWAKSYRLKGVTTEGKESKRAGWLYNILEKTMDKLKSNWTAQTRFSDEEKAQLFIGYLAAFPKKEINNENHKEEPTHE